MLGSDLADCSEYTADKRASLNLTVVEQLDGVAHNIGILRKESACGGSDIACYRAYEIAVYLYIERALRTAEAQRMRDAADGYSV